MMSDASSNSSLDAAARLDRRRRALRAAALAARESLAATDYAHKNARLSRYVAALLARLQPLRIAFCWPYRKEPDLRTLLAGWQAGDALRRVALPLVEMRDAPLRFREWTPQTLLEPDRYGIPTPTAASPELTPELVLVPLNAFDAAGYRLGYGGGYFDRTLAALQPAPLAVGVGFELGRVASTLPQPHDRPMDWIVTEAGSFPRTAP